MVRLLHKAIDSNDQNDYKAFVEKTNDHDTSLSNEWVRITNAGNVGIGTTSPTQDLHLHRSGTGDDVYIQFTNGDTGTTSGDGFQIGLAGNEDARIKQIENAPMEFWTNNTERMSISAAGDVTIAGGGLTLPATEKLYLDGGGDTYIVGEPVLADTAFVNLTYLRLFSLGTSFVESVFLTQI